MRALARRLSYSLGILWACSFAAGTANAQAPSSPPYPNQPGYAPPQAYPQQDYPQAQPQGYPQAQPQGYPQAQPQAYPQAQPYPQPQPGYPQPAYPQQQAQPYPPDYSQSQPYPQAAPPPQGYPPAQPYPPQAYPGQPYPPQGYPAQPYPPQGYYGQPPAYQPAPLDAEPPPPRHRGLLLLPYIGFNAVIGDAAEGYDAGFRMGGLLGFYAAPFVSLNGELSIDVLSPHALGSSKVSEGVVSFTLSPLFHFGPPKVDFVVGPRLGFFGHFSTLSNSYSSSEDTISMTGIAWGLNTGVFFSLGRIWLGGLMSLTMHSPTQYCYSNTSTNHTERCYDVTDSDTSSKLLTFNFALLF
jgi:hypothetical protein